MQELIGITKILQGFYWDSTRRKPGLPRTSEDFRGLPGAESDLCRLVPEAGQGLGVVPTRRTFKPKVCVHKSACLGPVGIPTLGARLARQVSVEYSDETWLASRLRRFATPLRKAYNTSTACKSPLNASKDFLGLPRTAQDFLGTP